MEMLDKRLNDKGKNWRHVFKVRFCDSAWIGGISDPPRSQALTVLDYCLHAGSENVIIYFK
jgi:epsin